MHHSGLWAQIWARALVLQILGYEIWGVSVMLAGMRLQMGLGDTGAPCITVDT